MALVVVKDWLSETLLYNLARMNTGDMRISLYKNDVTPDESSVFADFIPADFSGYGGPQTLSNWTGSPGGWDPPRWRISHPAVLWTPTAITTNVVYGYYVWQAVYNKLWWAERRPTGGITIGTVAGVPYVVIPYYTRRSEYPGD
jgi:hypothetical protein